MSSNLASIAHAIVDKLYFHLETCRTVANSGTGLKQLCCAVLKTKRKRAVKLWQYAAITKASLHVTWIKL